jgi:acetylornithine deacetylase/succinyl-diaminopimelate desuccinylase-like protein
MNSELWAFSRATRTIVLWPKSMSSIDIYSPSGKEEALQDGYDLSPKGTLVEALQETYSRRALPWSPTAFPSHSDANLLRSHGIKPILLGPGSLTEAQTPDESIEFQEVVAAADIYYQTIRHMFG